MKYLRTAFRVVRYAVASALILIFAAFVNYTVPSRDIVKVVGTEVVRTDVTGWRSIFWSGGSDGAGADVSGTRDIRFINTVFPSGETRVFRNEDTRWCCPPYLKFDSGDLQAEAQGYVNAESDAWVAVKHYGWRWTFISVYPNATSIKPVSGPDQAGLYWPEIVWYVVAAIFLMVFVRLCLILRRWVVDRTGWLKREGR